MLQKALREPLVHFLFAGSLLFVLFDLLPQKESEDASVIVVGNEQLLPLVMSRNPRLGLESANQYLQSLDEAQRERLTEDFVREEVLYRQAIALGLDENNYNARKRLIAQLEYINQGFIYDSLELSEAELVEHHKKNQDRYFVPPQVTFTHVYFSIDRRKASAGEQANDELIHLNKVSLPFHLAASRGDHFLYHRNYVNKNEPEVASHFGDSFATEVFAVDQAQDDWIGPFRSEYGFHLLLLTSVKEGYFPPLDEVRARIVDDVTQRRVREELDRIYQDIRGTYEVQIEAPENES
ncbi:MAG TPA: hypothetical protein DCM54_15450 [Gammaproteobacteria bacterium]|nr:hypothetical protein [Gammaproteobacteria bacterium]